MAKKNEVAVRAPQGGALAAPKKNLGMEKMRSDKLIIPRLGLAQSKSTIVEELHLAEVGNFYNSLTNEVYADGVEFVVIQGTFSRTKWIPFAEGGGIDCAALDGFMGNQYGPCAKCKFTAWQPDPKTGELTRPPLCTESDNFLVWMRGGTTPMLLSFSKSSAKAGNKLRTILMSFEEGTPAWSKVFKLTSTLVKKQIGKAASTVAVMQIAVKGDPTEAEMKKASQWYANLAARQVDASQVAQEAGEPGGQEEAPTQDTTPRASKGARVKGGGRNF